jgi:hypothetical protein
VEVDRSMSFAVVTEAFCVQTVWCCGPLKKLFKAE